jgi:5-methylcytosine-specific restriction endonuclease McrA
LSVFVLDTNKTPLAPCHEAKARKLLNTGKAAIFRRYPFTIILKQTIQYPSVPELRIKLDPGSKTTGIAIIDDTSGKVVFAAELFHRGQKIKEDLDNRRAVRRGRRNRKTRYRQARWKNRRNKKEGWLAPSTMSRITTILTWVTRLSKFCHIAAISMERVKFDMQLMENPEISGIEYQQGTLQGYEVKEYLLEKWGHKCTYCDKQGVPLQIDHIDPRANGGSHRICNLCLACEKCNISKGTKDIRDFLKKKPDLLKKILFQAKAPLRDAAAVNTTRWELFRQLQVFGLPIECGSGGLTKFNRSTRGLPKTHWIDAACVGESTPETLKTTGVQPLLITANGRGCRQVQNNDKYGFPKGSPKQGKIFYGFQTGDIVKAVVPNGKYAGTYVGRIAARMAGNFKFYRKNGTRFDVNYKYCKAVHHMDGYSYQRGEWCAIAHAAYAAPPSPLQKEAPFIPIAQARGTLAR